MNTIDYFEKNGYLVLTDVLSKQDCANLTQHMFNLLKEGKLVNDQQCPLSDAVYGDPVFDKLLVSFTDAIGKQVGRQLIPTYTYARIYRPGEILKKHKDRPACEISATLTLGFDAKSVWPIFFDEEKQIGVNLEVGEMAVYKGCDVVHWRQPFKGNWHVQVFLHYVDANGPYKHHAKDGRQDYGTNKESNVPVIQSYENIQKQTIQQQPVQPVNETVIRKPIFNTITIPNNDNTFPGYMCINSQNLPELMFTKDECARIVSIAQETYSSTASVGGTVESSKVDKSIRSAEIYNIDNTEENRWIFEKVANVVAVANKLHFDYEISGIIHGIQLIHYSAEDEVQGHYDWHSDSGPGDSATRKISFTAQLSDPNDYSECELIINNHGTDFIGTKEQGSIHLFPSYMVHQVTPITRGNRYALVIWIHGSRRFR